MASPAPDFSKFNLVHPDHYAEHGYPHETWAWLRKNDPVYFWEETGGIPFWAITKHADITTIGKLPTKFHNGPNLTIAHVPRVEVEFPPTLIQLDPPKHGVYRRLISKRFTPRALTRFHADIDRIGKEIVDNLVQNEAGECDFVSEISAPSFPTRVATTSSLPVSTSASATCTDTDGR